MRMAVLRAEVGGAAAGRGGGSPAMRPRPWLTGRPCTLSRPWIAARRQSRTRAAPLGAGSAGFFTTLASCEPAPPGAVSRARSASSGKSPSYPLSWRSCCPASKIRFAYVKGGRLDTGSGQTQRAGLERGGQRIEPGLGIRAGEGAPGRASLLAERQQFLQRTVAGGTGADPDNTPALVGRDRELLGNTLRSLRRMIGERGGAEQLLHGEPHPGNVLTTKNGPLFIDLETCCRGPVEFDLAHAPEEVSEHYPGVNQDLLRECRILVLAMVATWRWDRGDQFPNGRQLGTEWLSQIRAALDRYRLDVRR